MHTLDENNQSHRKYNCILPSHPRYCMKDPTKQPPYTCHGGVGGMCTDDDDCSSYCMIDPTKQPPYNCHRRNPPSLFVQRMNVISLIDVLRARAKVVASAE